MSTESSYTAALQDAPDNAPARENNSHHGNDGVIEPLVRPKPEMDDVIIDLPRELNVEEQAWLQQGKELYDKGVELLKFRKCSEAATALKAAVRFLETVRQTEPLAACYHHLGVVYNCANEPKAGIEPMEKAVDLRRNHPRPVRLLSSLACLSTLYRKAGNVKRAIAIAEETIQRARAAQADTMLVLGLVALARALTIQGENHDCVRAAQSYEEAIMFMDSGIPVPSVAREDLVLEEVLARLETRSS